jgi:2-oxo-4-hydroxy-4-carboxy-5-ureidoimidazoline decarboxylase
VESIGRLNTLPPDAFAAAIRPLFEMAPPLARALGARRPFASYAQLVDTAERLALSMPFEEQVAILSAHPRIGADPATLSPASLREQGTELGIPPADVQRLYGQLSELNARYEQQFGFRFVVFVDGRPKTEILRVLRERLHRGQTEELATGLTDMFRIARDRLKRIDLP